MQNYTFRLTENSQDGIFQFINQRGFVHGVRDEITLYHSLSVPQMFIYHTFNFGITETPFHLRKPWRPT